MPKIRKEVLASLVSIVILLTITLSPVRAAPPFVTLQEVLSAIANALLPVQSDIAQLDNRVEALESAVPQPTSSPSPLPTIEPNTKAVRVFDSNDQELGILLDGNFTNRFSIFIPSVNKVGIIANSYLEMVDFVFTTEDCSGTPYISANGNIATDNKVFSSHDGTYVTTVKTDIPTLRAIRSIQDWDTFTNSFNCRSLGFDFNTISVPAVQIDLPFTVPFALPIQLRHQ